MSSNLVPKTCLPHPISQHTEPEGLFGEVLDSRAGGGKVQEEASVLPESQGNGTKKDGALQGETGANLKELRWPQLKRSG